MNSYQLRFSLRSLSPWVGSFALAYFCAGCDGTKPESGTKSHVAGRAGEIHLRTKNSAVPLSIGIETMGGAFTKLVERNTTIPTHSFAQQDAQG